MKILTRRTRLHSIQYQEHMAHIVTHHGCCCSGGARTRTIKATCQQQILLPAKLAKKSASGGAEPGALHEQRAQAKTIPVLGTAICRSTVNQYPARRRQQRRRRSHACAQRYAGLNRAQSRGRRGNPLAACQAAHNFRCCSKRQASCNAVHLQVLTLLYHI